MSNLTAGAIRSKEIGNAFDMLCRLWRGSPDLERSIRDLWYYYRLRMDEEESEELKEIQQNVQLLSQE